MQIDSSLNIQRFLELKKAAQKRMDSKNVSSKTQINRFTSKVGKKRSIHTDINNTKVINKKTQKYGQDQKEGLLSAYNINKFLTTNKNNGSGSNVNSVKRNKSLGNFFDSVA